MFSCGLCGKLFNKLLPLLGHRVQHVEPGRGMACELCDSSTRYTQPAAFREHYRKVHKVTLLDSSSQRTCRSSSRKKPPRGNGSSSLTALKRLKTGRGVKTKGRLRGKQKENSAESEAQKDDGDIDGVANVVDSHGSNQLSGADFSEGNLVEGVGNTECDVSQVETVLTEDPQNVSGDNLTPLVEGREQNGSGSGDSADVSADNTSLVTETTSEGADTITKNSKDMDFYFLLVTSMVRGSSFIYGKQSFKCLHCDYKTFWRHAFTKHMKDRHMEVIHQHEFIEMKSTENNSDHKLMKMSEFIEHQAVTNRREKAVRAKRKVDNLGNFPCSNCNKVFNRWSYLRKHMRIHVPTKNFLCTECGKAFKTNTSLQQHLKTHQKEAYTCSVCGFKSNVNAAIHAHRQFHNQGSVLCDICGNAYTDKSTLNKHKRVHDPNRPFGCPWPDCTWRFKTEVMCNGHYRAHTTDAQFRCSLCGYVFRHKHHLRRHERQTHGIQHLKTRVPRSKVKEVEEAQAITNITVLHPSLEDGQIREVVESDGQILIPVASDGDGNPIPIKYDLTNLSGVNVAYQSVLQQVDGSTIYIPI